MGLGYDLNHSLILTSLTFMDCRAESKRDMAQVILGVLNPGAVPVPFYIGEIIIGFRIIRVGTPGYLADIPHVTVFRAFFGVFQFHHLVAFTESGLADFDFHFSVHRRIDPSLKLSVETVHTDKGVVPLRVEQDHVIAAVCLYAPGVHDAGSFKNLLLTAALDEFKGLSELQIDVSAVDFMSICNNGALPSLTENDSKLSRRDDTGMNQVRKYVPAADAWKLVDVSDKHHTGSGTDPLKQNACDRLIHHGYLIDDDKVSIQADRRLTVIVILLALPADRAVYGLGRISGCLRHPPGGFAGGSEKNRPGRRSENLLMNS